MVRIPRLHRVCGRSCWRRYSLVSVDATLTIEVVPDILRFWGSGPIQTSSTGEDVQVIFL